MHGPLDRVRGDRQGYQIKFQYLHVAPSAVKSYFHTADLHSGNAAPAALSLFDRDDAGVSPGAAAANGSLACVERTIDAASRRCYDRWRRREPSDHGSSECPSSVGGARVRAGYSGAPKLSISLSARLTSRYPDYKGRPAPPAHAPTSRHRDLAFSSSNASFKAGWSGSRSHQLQRCQGQVLATTGPSLELTPAPPQLSLLEWSPSAHDLLPVSLHTFEKLPQVVSQALSSR